MRPAWAASRLPLGLRLREDDGFVRLQDFLTALSPGKGEGRYCDELSE